MEQEMTRIETGDGIFKYSTQHLNTSQVKALLEAVALYNEGFEPDKIEISADSSTNTVTVQLPQDLVGVSMYELAVCDIEHADKTYHTDKDIWLKIHDEEIGTGKI